MNIPRSISGIPVVIFLSLFLFSQTAHSGLPTDVVLTHLTKATAKVCFCGIGDSANGPINDPPFNGVCTNGVAAGDGALETTQSNPFPSQCSCPNSSCDDPSPAINDPVAGTPAHCTLNVCRPKVNESYIWGLTLLGNILWFGTFSNALCQVGGAFFSLAFDLLPSVNNLSSGNPATVCEFEFGPSAPLLGPDFGDVVPPSIYAFDTTTNTLSEKSVVGCKSFTPGMTAEDILNETTGLRSAGSIGDFVFLGGPGLNGFNIFAFKASTQQCIGAKTFSQYNDGRKWLRQGTSLYVGVGNTSGGGSILRWAGSLTSPLNFITVGKTDGLVSNIASHSEGGKLYIAVTTWPDLSTISLDLMNIDLQALIQTLQGFASVYLSPVVPLSGLTSTHANQWKKVWSILNYEPGIVTAASIGGGDLASFGGYLHWGTMQVPLTGFIAHALVLENDILDCPDIEDECPDTDGVPGPPFVFDPACEAQACETRQDLAGDNTVRPTAIFRGKNLASITKKIELLYGEKDLPVFLPNQGGWTTQPNRLFQTPKYGPSGIEDPGSDPDPPLGSPYVYSWTAAVFKGKLYWGLFSSALTNGPLYRFNDVNSPAENVFADGAGNLFNYGVRTIVSGVCLYLGMANPFNLLTIPDAFPDGGWELKKLCSAP